MIRSGAVRSGAVRSGAVRTGDVASSGSNFHDGISFNASSGLVTIKAPGTAASVLALTSAFTFTGGNQSMYVGADGLLKQSVTNTPRIEYASTTIGTNLVTQSQNIDNASWTKTACVVTANTDIAPDATTTADKLVEDSSSTFHILSQSFNYVAGNTYMLSFYVKTAGRTAIQALFPAAAFTTATYAFFHTVTEIGRASCRERV